MTISEHITEQTNRLNLEKLTPEQMEWIHFINTLATWVWIAKTYKDLENRKAAA